MTEEERAAAWAEILETGRWLNSESTKIYEKLNREQGKNRKFDGGNEPYRELHKEFARRMAAIGKKYGLTEVKE